MKVLKNNKSNTSITLFTTILFIFHVCNYYTSVLSIVVPIQLYGLNYNTRQGPDWDPNRCKTRESIIDDLNVVSQITNNIRILSLIDCNQGELVLDVITNVFPQMTLWLGIWLGPDGNVFQDEYDILEQMLNDNKINPSIVTGITVGSEAILRKDVTAKQAVEYQQRIKQLVISYPATANIPISIVDIKDIFQNPANRQIMMNASDILVVNVFPFWEQLPIDRAVDYLVYEKMPPFLQIANYYNKEVMYGETGWSSAGYSSRASEASLDNQIQYFQEFYCIAHLQLKWKYYYFTSIEMEWRIEQANDTESVEGHFGIFNVNRTLKSNFQNMTFQCPGNNFIEHKFIITDTTNTPTISPPTNIPTYIPSQKLTTIPTNIPTQNPTNIPTIKITQSPTQIPITIQPTSMTFSPTLSITDEVTTNQPMDTSPIVTSMALSLYQNEYSYVAIIQTISLMLMSFVMVL